MITRMEIQDREARIVVAHVMYSQEVQDRMLKLEGYLSCTPTNDTTRLDLAAGTTGNYK